MCTQAIFMQNDWFWLIDMLLWGVLGLLYVENKKFAWIDISGFSLAALVFIAVPLDHESRIAIVFGTPGVVWTLRGTLTLLQYMRRNPLPQS
jgi:hypothetical protein